MKNLYTVLALALITSIASAQVTVTYEVDVSNYITFTTITEGGMRVGGDFGTNEATNATTGEAMVDWTPTDPNSAMVDMGDNIWSISVTYPASSIGNTQQYKFVNGDWGMNEGTDTSLIADAGCGVDDGSGNINRNLVIPGNDIGYQYCYDACTKCDGSAPEIIAGIFTFNPAVSSISVYPNPAVSNINVNFEIVKPGDITFEVFSLTGQLLISETEFFNFSGNAVKTLNVSSLASGLYTVMVNNGESRGSTSLNVK